VRLPTPLDAAEVRAALARVDEPGLDDAARERIAAALLALR
jgi:hypothetical protein